jgi:hypothetical protein
MGVRVRIIGNDTIKLIENSSRYFFVSPNAAGLAVLAIVSEKKGYYESLCGF